jgi:hypothetical protein
MNAHRNNFVEYSAHKCTVLYSSRLCNTNKPHTEPETGPFAYIMYCIMKNSTTHLQIHRAVYNKRSHMQHARISI